MTNSDLDLIDEQVLRDALGPVRCDADRFAAEVRRRIEERERAAHPHHAEGFLARIAAGMLPAGGSAIGASGKSAVPASSKSVLAVIPWIPAILLGAVVVTFVSAVRRLRPMRADGVAGAQDVFQIGPDPETMRRTWMVFGWLIYGLVPLWFSVDVMLALVLASMIAWLHLVRRCDAAAVAGRVQIANASILALWILLVITIGVSTQGSHRALPLIALAGIGGCWALGGRLPVLSRTRTQKVVNSVVMALASTYVIWLAIRPGLPSATDLRAYLDKHPWDDRWSHGDRIRRGAVALGEVEANPLVVAPIDAARLEVPKRLLTEEGPVAAVGPNLLGDVELLIRSDSLDEAARDHLRDRLLASLPEPRPSRLKWNMSGPWELTIFDSVVRVLDRIDRPSDDALRAPVHDSLNACFESSLGDAGFVGWRGEDRVVDEPTFDAVELMARFGVPPGVDIEALRRSLRASARLFPFESPSRYELLPAVTLARVDALWPKRWSLLDWRLEIAVGLFVLLCLMSCLAAPRDPEPVAT